MVKRYFEVATSHGYNLATRKKSSVSRVLQTFFLFGDSISLFWFHFNHIKKTNIPKPIPEFLGPQLHNSPSPISPTPGNHRTVSTKLPACRRCNAERSLNSNDTVKALEKVDQKTPFWLGKPTGFSNQKNVVLMFLGFKTATVVAF